MGGLGFEAMTEHGRRCGYTAECTVSEYRRSRVMLDPSGSARRLLCGRACGWATSHEKAATCAVPAVDPRGAPAEEQSAAARPRSFGLAATKTWIFQPQEWPK